MCIVSAIGDSFTPRLQPYSVPEFQWSEVPRSEFDRLKEEVERIKELLKAAKKFDEANGEPNCELDEKVAVIKKVAESLGVDLEEVFG